MNYRGELVSERLSRCSSSLHYFQPPYTRHDIRDVLQIDTISSLWSGSPGSLKTCGRTYDVVDELLVNEYIGLPLWYCGDLAARLCFSVDVVENIIQRIRECTRTNVGAEYPTLRPVVSYRLTFEEMEEYLSLCH